MKTAESPLRAGIPGRPGRVAPTDGRTRVAVARLLLEQGPIPATAIAAELALSGPAVRRHLDALIADGEAHAAQPARRGPRGRGRPAREYALTDAGRARFGHGYDELAVAALQYLARHGGRDAVAGFARARVADLLSADRERLAAAGSARSRADVLAGLLSANGYAAQVRTVGPAPHTDGQIDASGERPDVVTGGLLGHGVQLCQHHCPVAHVAAEFPEICEAETEAFAAVLGTHVQRLATIARGDTACTTHVPLDPPDPRPPAGSSRTDPTTAVPARPTFPTTTTTGDHPGPEREAV